MSTSAFAIDLKSVNLRGIEIRETSRGPDGHSKIYHLSNGQKVPIHPTQESEWTDLVHQEQERVLRNYLNFEKDRSPSNYLALNEEQKREWIGVFKANDGIGATGDSKFFSNVKSLIESDFANMPDEEKKQMWGKALLDQFEMTTRPPLSEQEFREKYPQLLRMFQQAQGTTLRKEGGLGIKAREDSLECLMLDHLTVDGLRSQSSHRFLRTLIENNAGNGHLGDTTCQIEGVTKTISQGLEEYSSRLQLLTKLSLEPKNAFAKAVPKAITCSRSEIKDSFCHHFNIFKSFPGKRTRFSWPRGDCVLMGQLIPHDDGVYFELEIPPNGITAKVVKVTSLSDVYRAYGTLNSPKPKTEKEEVKTDPPKRTDFNVAMVQIERNCLDKTVEPGDLAPRTIVLTPALQNRNWIQSPIAVDQPKNPAIRLEREPKPLAY